MTRCVRVLEERPWLLPLAWAIAQGVPCDPVLLAEALGVPSRLARSLVYAGRRVGLCQPCSGVTVVRVGPEFAAETSAFILYARVKKRRVSGVSLSKSGVEGERSKRLVERALEILGSAPDHLS